MDSCVSANQPNRSCWSTPSDTSRKVHRGRFATTKPDGFKFLFTRLCEAISSKAGQHVRKRFWVFAQNTSQNVRGGLWITGSGLTGLPRQSPSQSIIKLLQFRHRLPDISGRFNHVRRRKAILAKVLGSQIRPKQTLPCRIGSPAWKPRRIFDFLDQSLRHARRGESVCPDPSHKKLPEIAKHLACWINKNLTILLGFFLLFFFCFCFFCLLYFW
jgi:hypothetical protein